VKKDHRRRRIWTGEKDGKSARFDGWRKLLAYLPAGSVRWVAPERSLKVNKEQPMKTLKFIT